MINEIWKNIHNYNGVYQVSNFGHVKSFHKSSERILKPQANPEGYLSVMLYRIGSEKAKYHSIHRLVAKNFKPNKNASKLEVNHLDGNKKNNRIANLDWVTRSQNQKHAFRTGLNKCHIGVNNSRAVFTEKQVCEIRKAYAKGNISQRKLAKNYFVSRGAIVSIINFLTWKHVK